MMTSIFDNAKVKDSLFHVSRTLTELSIVKQKDSIEMASRDLVRQMADFLVRNPKLTRIGTADVFGSTMVRIDVQVAVLALGDLRNLLEEVFAKGVRHGQGMTELPR